MKFILWIRVCDVIISSLAPPPPNTLIKNKTFLLAHPTPDITSNTNVMIQNKSKTIGRYLIRCNEDQDLLPAPEFANVPSFLFRLSPYIFTKLKKQNKKEINVKTFCIIVENKLQLFAFIFGLFDICFLCENKN